MRNLYDRMKALLRPRDKDRQVEDARRAEQWLEDPILDLALAQMRETVLLAWHIELDPDARERCWVTMRVIDEFAGELKAIIGQGVKVQKDANRKPMRGE